MFVVSVAIIFMTRVLLIALFLPFSALDKVLNTRMAVGQAATAVRSPVLARTLIAVGGVVEVTMSLAILTGFADRLAALILGGYCLVTAFVWKQFWKTPDCRLQGISHGRELFWDFLKNIGLAGAFFMLAFGTNITSVRSFFINPFDSTHPYQNSAEAGR
jgi:putative oxidoreductase